MYFGWALAGGSIQKLIVMLRLRLASPHAGRNHPWVAVQRRGRNTERNPREYSAFARKLGAVGGPPAGRRVRVNHLHHQIGARKTKNAPPAINANPITWFQVSAWC